MIRIDPRPLLLAVALVCAALTGSVAATLGGEALDQRVLEIADELRCPTCQAISVRDSEAAFSRQIRDKVRAMLEEGRSEDEIKAYFVSRYGEWILRAPKKEGVGLLLWVLPGLGMLVAGGLILWRLRREPRPDPASVLGGEPLSAEPLSGADRALLDRDLRRFERGT
jgi:cytochrome c-type biogenesis protein CcmH